MGKYWLAFNYTWLTFAILPFVLYFPTRWVAEYEQAKKLISWLKFF